MNFWKDRKVVVAGGAGLIGQALIRALIPLGAKVTATEYKNRLISQDYRFKCEDILHGADLNDYEIARELYEGEDIVFWAAAKVGGAAAIKSDPMGLVHYNLELAAKNIKAAVDAKVGRFCYVSSSYVYPEFDEPCIETDINIADVPLQHYGLGWIKRFIERLCQAHQLTSDTRFALVRPAAIYGPFDNFDLESCHVIPALIRKVVEGQNPLQVWGDGSELRQFTYVDDLVQGMLRATSDYACASPINIAYLHGSSVNDIWKTLFEIEGLTHDCYDPISGRFPVGIPKEKLRGVFYLGDKPRTISKRLIDTNLCAFRLCYECKTDLKTGLKKTLEWYRGYYQAESR